MNWIHPSFYSLLSINLISLFFSSRFCSNKIAIAFIANVSNLMEKQDFSFSFLTRKYVAAAAAAEEAQTASEGKNKNKP